MKLADVSGIKGRISKRINEPATPVRTRILETNIEV
jgi:hypothetical protein